MPLLKNPKHEAFAQALARGAGNVEAHTAAGYKPDASAASTLSNRSSIVTRVEEIRKELTSGSIVRVGDTFHPDDVTTEWLITEFYKQVVIGRDVGDMQSSNKALEIIGKLAGLIERPRTGRPPREPLQQLSALRREAKDIQETVGLLEQIDHDA
ncbi:MAG: hypothetical protein IPO08_18460 [Xanthomonadales bacterium]|nr:hypothetical protein [Xanthomonadales bacterium]